MSQVYKILVIDDDEEGGFNHYKFLAGVSEEPKFELMWQRSGVKAIEFLKAQAVDLIILDQRFILSGALTPQEFYLQDTETGEIHPLPSGATSQDVEPHQGEQGFLILAKLQQEERTRQIPVIFCTAFPEEDLGVRSIKGGASDYWPKASLQSPDASYSIISQIKRVLDIPETLAETTEALLISSGARIRKPARDHLLNVARKFKCHAKAFVARVVTKVGRGQVEITLREIMDAVEAVQADFHIDHLSPTNFAQLLGNRFPEFKRDPAEPVSQDTYYYTVYAEANGKTGIVKILKPEAMKKDRAKPNPCQLLSEGAQFGTIQLEETDPYLGSDFLVFGFFPIPWWYKTLRRYLDERGRLPPGEVKKLALAISEKLQTLNEQGLFHGSLNLENILCEPSGSVYLLASELTEWVEYPGNAYAGAHFGGPRKDLFSLGVIIHEMVAGFLPYDKQTEFSYLDKSLREICQGCLNKVNYSLSDLETDFSRVEEAAVERLPKLTKLGNFGRTPDYLRIQPHEPESLERIWKALVETNSNCWLFSNGFYVLDERFGYQDNEIDILAVSEFGIFVFECKSNLIYLNVKQLHKQDRGVRSFLGRMVQKDGVSLPVEITQELNFLPTEEDFLSKLGSKVNSFFLVPDRSPPPVPGTPQENIKRRIKTVSQAAQVLTEGLSEIGGYKSISPNKVEEIGNIIKKYANSFDHLRPGNMLGSFKVEKLRGTDRNGNVEFFGISGGNRFLLREHLLLEKLQSKEKIGQVIDYLMKKMAPGVNSPAVFSAERVILVDAEWTEREQIDADIVAAYEIFPWKEKETNYMSLRELAGTPVSLKDKLKLMIDMAEGLSMIHEIGCVHGGVSPDNVAVFEDDKGNATRAAMQISNAIQKGLPAEVSVVEDVEFYPDKVISKHSDMYALGKTLSEFYFGGKSSGKENGTLKADSLQKPITEIIERLMVVTPTRRMDLGKVKRALKVIFDFADLSADLETFFARGSYPAERKLRARPFSSEPLRLVNDLPIGTVFNGVVTKVVPDGFLVDLGVFKKRGGLLSAELGLLQKKDTPRGIWLNIGEEIRVRVLAVDPEKNQFNLGFVGGA